MAYLKINNLYRFNEILNFKELYSLEKIHGTSAHITIKRLEDKTIDIKFFAGGSKHETFVSLFNQDELKERFNKYITVDEITIFGEAYGGNVQAMKDVYGDKLKFIAFDVCINDKWLDVPNARDIADKMALDFVHFEKTTTDLETLDKLRNQPSTQAIRNGCGNDKESEGIILRPLIELTMNNGERMIAKYKREKFREMNTPREIKNVDLKVLEDAKAIAVEWVTPMRLQHVLQKFPEHTIEMTGEIIKAMKDDITIEAKGEIIMSSEAEKEINRATATLYKQYLFSNLK